MDEAVDTKTRSRQEPQVETQEAADWQKRNLERNFPHYEVVITHDQVEEQFGENFAQITQELSEMDDTFYLCGVIADTAAGVLKSESWQEASYSPVELQKVSKNREITKEGPTTWDAFNEKHKHLIPEGFKYKAVLNPDNDKRDVPEIAQELSKKEIPIVSLEELLVEEGDNKALGINVLCEYPRHEGTHTHWLAATAYEDGILLVGDLSPFGINAVGIKVNKQELERGMSAVIGSSPTTKLTDTVSESSIAEGTMSNNKRFITNAFVMKTT